LPQLKEFNNSNKPVIISFLASLASPIEIVFIDEETSNFCFNSKVDKWLENAYCFNDNINKRENGL